MNNDERVRLYRDQVAYLRGRLADLDAGSIEARRVAEGLCNARHGLRRATLAAMREEGRNR